MKFKSKGLSDGSSVVVPANEPLALENVQASNTTPTAAVTLTASDSGKDIYLDAAAGFAITLPAVTSGLKYKFIVGSAFATTDFTVVAATSVIQGGAIVNSTFVAASDENTISFVASAETVGDYIELSSDGTNWYASGVGAGAGSITFTDV